MSLLFDWKIQDIERTANEAKNRLYEIDSLRSEVARLEAAVREARHDADQIRVELKACQERITYLDARLDEMSQNK